MWAPGDPRRAPRQRELEALLFAYGERAVTSAERQRAAGPYPGDRPRRPAVLIPLEGAIFLCDGALANP